MTFPRPPKYQATSFWLSMPLISLAFCYILYGERIFTDVRIWLVPWSIIYFVGYFSYRMHYWFNHTVQQKYPSLKDTYIRVLWKVPLNLFVMTPSVMLIILLFHWFHVLGYTLNTEHLKYGYMIGLATNIVFESLWEVIYIIDKYREAAAEKEMIEQMQLRQEFDNLKEKVNPHFLFNSFNTLSSLISEDKDQAEKFLDELSKVYRYLLRNNESGMSTVGQEVAFIRSYSRLLETRYGDGYRMVLSIDPGCIDREIPSLSLQLLVENAVKHNVVSKVQPITVHIYTNTDGYIVVENNLNKKARLVQESTGIGLANIREKYRLLNRDDILVEETADTFTVSLPMI
jgi:two-component system LytT family sensor kinase